MTDRTCTGCGTDLTGLNPAVKRCGECCADIMRAAGLEPLEPYPGSAHSPWEARCLTCSDVVSPHLANVQTRGRGCDTCGRRAGAQTRRVSETEAVAVMLAAGVEPLVPYPDAREPWKSRCMTCRTVVYPRYNDVQQGQGGCWPCGRASMAAAQRIPEDEAVALAAAAGLKPLEPYSSNHAGWLCQCLTCGKVVSPMLTSLQRGSRGCGYCSGHYADPGEARETMLALGLEPLEPYTASNVRWKCLCLNCGSVVHPTYSSVRAGHRGRCCASRGFRASADAVVYLITHVGYGAVKIGVSGTSTNRLRDHQRLGWQVVATINVLGEVALAVEDGILAWWRTDLGLPVYLGPQDMPLGGWTETADLVEVDLAAAIRRMRSIAVA